MKKTGSMELGKGRNAAQINNITVINQTFTSQVCFIICKTIQRANFLFFHKRKNNIYLYYLGLEFIWNQP